MQNSSVKTKTYSRKKDADRKSARSLEWDTRGNIVALSHDGYTNTYSYDGLRRLTQVLERGPVDLNSAKAKTISYGTRTGDVGGRKELNFNIPADSHVTFDYHASSIGILFLVFRHR